MDGSSTPARTASVPAASLKGDTAIEEPGRAGRAIARRSAEIRATVPDLELSVEADAGALLARAAAERCTTTALLVAACAGALRAFPRVNGAYRDGRYELYSRVNVGVVTQIPEGPVTATGSPRRSICKWWGATRTPSPSHSLTPRWSGWRPEPAPGS